MRKLDFPTWKKRVPAVNNLLMNLDNVYMRVHDYFKLQPNKNSNFIS